MIDSLALYKAAMSFAKENPLALRNFYLQLITLTFYELIKSKSSSLISALCRANDIALPTKNFSLKPAPASFDLPTSFDLAVLVYGLNVALAENLDSCLNVFDNTATRIFRGEALNAEDFQELQNNLTALDTELGKFQAVDVHENLNALAESRRLDDEKIVDEIKQLQLTTQDTLKKISEIRDELDFKTLEEPIYQLAQLFDMINETAERHPQEDTFKGYDKLIKRCKSFSRYVEQSLAMLGAQLINETDTPLDTSRHKVTDTALPSSSAKVAKVLKVGLIYKGRIIRKAEVEVVEPVLNQYAELRQKFGR